MALKSQGPAASGKQASSTNTESSRIKLVATAKTSNRKAKENQNAGRPNDSAKIERFAILARERIVHPLLEGAHVSSSQW